jgi:hypothetical protein
MENYLVISRNDNPRTAISNPMTTVQTLLIFKFK